MICKMGQDDLNSLLFKRLSEFLASWLLRPSAVTTKCPKYAPPMRLGRKTVPISQLQPLPFPILSLLICGLLVQHPEVPIVDQKGSWNQSLTARLWNKLLCPSGPQFLILLLPVHFFSHITVFSTTNNSSKIYPKTQSKDFPGGPVVEILCFH